MDVARARAWIAQQIEEHAPTLEGTLTTASRLADAAAALRPGSDKPQVFGLALSGPRDESFEPLYERCLALLADWAKLLEPPLSSELAALMDQLGLPKLSEPTPHPNTVATLRVLLPVVVERFDETSEDYVPTTDVEVLAQLDGARASGGDILFDIACMRHASGGSGDLKGVRTDYGWAHGSAVALEYDRDARALRCVLVCELNRTPLRGQIDQLLAAIQNELFYTGWGLNLEWEGPETDGLLVHVRSAPIRHEIVPGQPRGS